MKVIVLIALYVLYYFFFSEISKYIYQESSTTGIKWYDALSLIILIILAIVSMAFITTSILL